jgi:arylsulfatase A-like enzyme
VGPTILDLFGIPVPEHCDGRSIFSDLTGKDVRQDHFEQVVSA